MSPQVEKTKKPFDKKKWRTKKYSKKQKCKHFHSNNTAYNNQNGHLLKCTQKYKCDIK